MATEKNQSESIVLDIVIRTSGGEVVVFKSAGDLLQRGIEATAATNRVDRFETSGGDEPGAWFIGETFAGSLPDSSGERLVHRLLGEIEVPQ